MSVVFALDSSGKTAGVCVLSLEEGGAQAILYQETVNTGLTHSETLLPLVQMAMAAAGITPAGVGLFAVAGGPGSFTGLRIGMALAKGMALPNDTPTVAVSTLEALAEAVREAGLRGTVVTALDARRKQVYWAAFESGETVRRLAPDAAAPAADLAAFLETAGAPVYFVGDGAEICYTIYNDRQGVLRPSLDGPPPIATGVARIAARMMLAGQTQPAAAMRPRYLRLSQAERERAEKLAGRQGVQGSSPHFERGDHIG